VRWLVLRQALMLVLAGVIVGLPAAMGVGTLLKGLLFGLGPTHPTTLILATLTSGRPRFLK
jgi:putative ABC transport system permease protein